MEEFGKVENRKKNIVMIIIGAKKQEIVARQDI